MDRILTEDLLKFTLRKKQLYVSKVFTGKKIVIVRLFYHFAGIFTVTEGDDEVLRTLDAAEAAAKYNAYKS